MSRYSQNIFLALVCLNLIGCSPESGELKTAEQLMESTPDSTLAILKQLSPDKYSSESDRALYGLLLFNALDKNRLPLNPDTLIDFSINYYLKHTDKDRLAYCYLLKGRIYKYDLQYENAIGLYLKALDLCKDSKNKLLLGRIYSDMGEIYHLQGDYRQAQHKFKLAYNCFIHGNYSNPAYYSLLNIGITHFDTKRYDSAQVCFQQVYRQAKDSIIKGAALSDIGLCYYHAKLYDSALYYFRKSIHYPAVENNRAIRYFYLADLFFDQGKFDSAGYYALNTLQYVPDIRSQRECYRILLNSESAKGNIETITQTMGKYHYYSDSIRKIDAQTKGSILETIHIANKQIEQTKQQRAYLFILLLLIMPMGLLMFFRTRNRFRLDKYQTEAKYLQQQTALRKEMFNKYRITLLQQIDEIKTGQAAEHKQASLTMKENLDRRIYDQLLHLNDRNLFYYTMDTQLNGLVTKLKTRYPSLNDKEITWCCLHILHLPAVDILMLLDQRVSGLKKFKQRLAIKTKLSGITALDDFLNKLLFEE